MLKANFLPRSFVLPASAISYTILYYDIIKKYILYYTILNLLYYSILNYSTLYYTTLHYTILVSILISQAALPLGGVRGTLSARETMQGGCASLAATKKSRGKEGVAEGTRTRRGSERGRGRGQRGDKEGVRGDKASRRGQDKHLFTTSAADPPHFATCVV